MWEVLYYAAMLRLPRTMSKAHKMERVSTVIKALGIEKCKDTIIGESCMESNLLAEAAVHADMVVREGDAVTSRT